MASQKNPPLRPVRDLLNGRFLPGAANFVHDMLYSGCSRPFYIYALTFIPAFLDAIITLRTWDLNDMVRKTGETLAPPGGKRRGVRHGRGVKTGKALSGTGRERVYRQGLRTLLFLTAPLEKIGFAVLLYSVVDNFYYNWLMYLDDADACIKPDFYGPLHRRATDYDWSCLPNGGPASLPDLISDPAGWGSSAFSASLPIGRYTIMFAGTIVGASGGPQGYRLRLLVTGALGHGEYLGEVRTIDSGDTGDLVVTADVLLPFVTGGNVGWELVGPAVPVGVHVTQGDIIIQRRADALDTPS